MRRPLAFLVSLVLAAVGALATASDTVAQPTPTAVQVANVAMLRAGAFGTFVFLQGKANPGDGGGGFFARTFSSCTDDGYNFLKQADGQCLARLTTAGGTFVPTSPQAFGAKMDGATNDCTALTNMAAALTTAGGGIVGMSGMLAVSACPTIHMPPQNLRVDCTPGAGGFVKVGTTPQDDQLEFDNPNNIVFNDCTFNGNNRTQNLATSCDWLCFFAQLGGSGRIVFRNTVLQNMAAPVWVSFYNTSSAAMREISFTNTRIYATNASTPQVTRQEAIGFYGTGTGTILGISVRDTHCEGAYLNHCVSIYDGTRNVLVQGGWFDNVGGSVPQNGDSAIGFIDNAIGGGAVATVDGVVRDIVCYAPHVSCVAAANAFDISLLNNSVYNQATVAGAFASFDFTNTGGIIAGNFTTNPVWGFRVMAPFARNGQGVVLSDNHCATSISGASCYLFYGNAAGNAPDADTVAIDNSANTTGSTDVGVEFACSATRPCRNIKWSGGNIVVNAGQYGMFFDDGANLGMGSANSVSVSDVTIGGNVNRELFIAAGPSSAVLFTFSNLTLDLSKQTASGQYGFAAASPGPGRIIINGLNLSNWQNPGGSGGVAYLCQGCAGALQDVVAFGGSQTNLLDPNSWGILAPSCTSSAAPQSIQNLNPLEQGSAGSKYIVTGWICNSGGAVLQQRTLTGN